MNERSRRQELKEFLRARRNALRPDVHGLSAGGRRRTTGLRREELAQIADVGITWYTWLEQGRDIRPSIDVFYRIAHALRLTPSDTEYLFALAGLQPPEVPPSTADVAPHLQTILDGLGAVPAVVTGPRLDVLACNSLANEIFELDRQKGAFARNHVWRDVVDPSRRRLYGERWEEYLDVTIGILRARYAAHIGDPEFEELVGALRARSKDFDRIWNAKKTARLEPVIVRLRHPRLGVLTVATLCFLLTSRKGEALFTLPAADQSTGAVFSRFTHHDR